MPKGDKYLALKKYLLAQKTQCMEMSFEEIEEVLGFALPTSARNLQNWWGNGSGHSQEEAWKNAGYRIKQVNLCTCSAVFEKL